MHAQLVATALSTSADRVAVRQSDTDIVEHDTGAFGSTGTVVAGKASHAAAKELAAVLRKTAAVQLGADLEDCVLGPDGVRSPVGSVSLSQLHRASEASGAALMGHGYWGGTPRSVAFNVHGVRVAVNRRTGELKILQSVQAADAGVVLNPMQCRGQVEGGSAQALGAALYEDVVIDDTGAVTTSVLRSYHIPTFADTPRTEVYFTTRTDATGPLGAKSMSESPFNPVAPALGNAIRHATGVRMTSLPMARDEIYLAMRAAGLTQDA